MSRNIVRHVRFSKSEYEAVSRKADYLKMPEGRFIRKIAIQGNLRTCLHKLKSTQQGLQIGNNTNIFLVKSPNFIVL